MSQAISESLNTAYLTEDDYYALLAAEERRLVLEILTYQGESTMSLMEIASEIAKRKQNSDPHDQEDITAVAVGLHHVHLRKMGNLGVIHYDSKAKVIRPGSGVSP